MSVPAILIAEYDVPVARELAAHLEGFGYKILAIACSSEDTLAKIQEYTPDLVLLNIRLMGVLDRIRTGSLKQSYGDFPIVFLANCDGKDILHHAEIAEPLGYICKPFDEKQIYATIETALAKHELEIELHQSRQWLNTALSSIGDGVIATDEHGRVRFINPAAIEQTGWHHTEAMGRFLPDVFSIVDENTLNSIDVLKTEQVSDLRENQEGFAGFLLPKNKNPIPVEVKSTLIRNGQGNIHGQILIFRDVTHQRKILQEAKRRAEQAEALVRVASMMDTHLELDEVLSTICEVTNRTLRASATVVLLHPDRKETLQSRVSTSPDPALKSYQGELFEVPTLLIERLVSRERPVIVIDNLHEHPELPFFEFYKSAVIRTLIIAGLFRDEGLNGALILAYSQQPKTLLDDEAVLLKGLADQAASAIENAGLFEQVRAGRERQRNLAKSLVDIQETERRRIARELHDHLGQVLTGLQFMLETSKNQAAGEQRTNLEQIQETVSEIIRGVREMSLNLRPSMLDDMGLVPTLLWHIDRYKRQTGIHVNFQYDKFSNRLPLEIETAAYRIVQEALTNAARYAQVQEVFVGLVIQNETLWVEVLDNGKGFDRYTELNKPSSGLSGMRERAFLLGGYLLVESFINQGTQIVAALPLTDSPLERRKHERHTSHGR